MEDDATLADAVLRRLTRDGHAADHFTTLEDARLAMDTAQYDFVLLDLSLPDGSGLDLLRSLRRGRARVPVLVLTARDRIEDRINGLNAGADDYLVKPFDMGELSARVNAVARRSSGLVVSDVTIGDIAIDVAGRSVRVGDRGVSLTAREWVVLEFLIARSETTVTKDELETRMYDFGAQIASNTVEVFVSRIRKKLGRDLIRTERGLGYRLVTQ